MRPNIYIPILSTQNHRCTARYNEVFWEKGDDQNCERSRSLAGNENGDDDISIDDDDDDDDNGDYDDHGHDVDIVGHDDDYDDNVKGILVCMS